MFDFYEFTQLNKTHRIEKKFKKTKNDLQFKFFVFHNKGKRIKLLKNAYIMIASIILKNQIFIFYYNDDQYIS